jgi:hypothetical protein
VRGNTAGDICHIPTRAWDKGKRGQRRMREANYSQRHREEEAERDSHCVFDCEL